MGLVSVRSSWPGESNGMRYDPFRSSRDLGLTWPEAKLWPWSFKVILYMVRHALTRQTRWYQNRCSTFNIKDLIVEKQFWKILEFWTLVTSILTWPKKWPKWFRNDFFAIFRTLPFVFLYGNLEPRSWGAFKRQAGGGKSRGPAGRGLKGHLSGWKMRLGKNKGEISRLGKKLRPPPKKIHSAPWDVVSPDDFLNMPLMLSTERITTKITPPDDSRPGSPPCRFAPVCATCKSMYHCSSQYAHLPAPARRRGADRQYPCSPNGTVPPPRPTLGLKGYQEHSAVADSQPITRAARRGGQSELGIAGCHGGITGKAAPARPLSLSRWRPVTALLVTEWCSMARLVSSLCSLFS